eukprot:TRINITY_DN613_c0_g1_i1.p1 TRINITY_DN613_c0_g1~~TRINITY_DN613_c0_g1_i1.p1  ORF type:complete len:276 (-),score=69.30 TRINITY_DN613_c0_g1_i1:202-1029(-)
MGCGQSTVEEIRNKQITNDIQKEKSNLGNQIKLLLLGTGESGKSTLAKQMKIIYLKGFSESELLQFKPVIQSNAIEAIKLLVNACKVFEYELEETNMKIAHPYYDIYPLKTPMTPDIRDDIDSLWKDEAVQKAWKRNGEFQLLDSSGYFLDNIDRISQNSYVPTSEDALKCRVRTTGINEMDFAIGKMNFKMVDVGGQRTERKKWVHCFQNVTGIIFVIAINEYDLTLFEDDNVNRMEEACQLFDEICNSQWFLKSSMILFLNKKDLFEEKNSKC